MANQKRVLVDLGKLKDLHCGLGQVSLQLGRALDGYEDEQLKIHFLVPPGFEEQFSSPCEVLSPRRRHFTASCQAYDLWHAIHQDSSYLPPKHIPYVLTIHDLNFMGEKSPRKAMRRLSKVQRKVERASAITSISRFTFSELEKHLRFGDCKPQTIYQGVEFGSMEQAKPSVVAHGPFIFALAVVARKKNFHTLVPMMRELPQLRLYIAGKNDGEYGDYMRQCISESGLQDRVVLLGRVSDEEKNWLYAHCEAFTFPSLFEGFGMPVIEAYHHGKPVVTTRKTAIPEFAGDLARYFDEDFSPELMAKQVISAIDGDSKLLQQERVDYAAGFSWANTAQSYVNLYKQTLGAA